MRKTIQLGELKPNPFKKFVNGGKLNQATVTSLEGRIQSTTLWEQWVVRETIDDKYEMAFGHHRLQAAINLFGKKHEVSVQVEDYDDALMLKSLANENAEDDRATTIRDTLLVARKFLIEHPEKCVLAPGVMAPSASTNSKAREGCKIGDHGSSACISHFLSDRAWSERTIREYLGIAEDVADYVANNGSTHPERQNKIPLKAAVAISQLPTKEIRQATVSAVKEANKDQNEPVITAKDVKRIVDSARSAPVPQQKKIIQQEVKKHVAAKKVSYFTPSKVSVKDIDTDFLKDFMDEIRRSKQYPRQAVKFNQVPGSVIKIANEVIDAGLRSLALKKHPDHGGTQEEMQALNAAVAWLRLVVEKEKGK